MPRDTAVSGQAYVWVYQQFCKALKYPVLARMVKDTSGGRCVVEVAGVQVAINRGACTQTPFDPYDSKEFQNNVELRKPKFVDPVYGAPVRGAPNKKAVRDNGEQKTTSGNRRRKTAAPRTERG